MVNKKKRASQIKSKKVSKKHANGHLGSKKPQGRIRIKPAQKAPVSQVISVPARSLAPPAPEDSRVFTIEIDSIRAETTIGDLIVAFPRTRDVLMKHGLRFDVEEAGYLYMSLNVFSAIHGLAITNLIQELDVASKELPPPPLLQPPRQIAPPATT